MKLINNNKIVSGLIYNGINYGGTTTPKIKHIFSKELHLKRYVSASAEQTEGYAVSSVVTTNEQFELYKSGNLTTPLNYLPIYKFVLQNTTETILTDWILVYDGDNLFHIEGPSDSILLGYSTNKLLQQEVNLCLVDENQDLFITNKNLFSQSISDSIATIDYVSSTLTSEQARVEEIIIEEIILPYSIESISVTPKSFYLAQSVDGLSTYKLDYEASYIL